MPDPMMMPPGAAGMLPPGPDMGMVPPEPGMMPPGAPMDMAEVPPGPEQLLGSTPEAPPITVPGWVPADPAIPVDETTCAEIGAIPYQDKQGNSFCMVPPPGGLPPGPGGPLGM